MARDESDIERRSRRRSRMMVTLAALLIILSSAAIQVGALMSETAHPRNVDIVRYSGFLAFAGVAAIRFLFGIRFGRAEEDELTRFHRAKAVGLGYMLTLLCVAAGVIASFFVELSLKELAPAIALIGVGAPLMRFAALERAAERNG